MPQGTQAGELISTGYQGAVYKRPAGADVPADARPASGFIIIKQAIGSGIPRFLRRAMIRREFRVYQRLRGVPGVPRCYGLRDADHLVLEYIDSESLRECDKSLADPDEFYALLQEVILSVHAAGVAHTDLKRKNNVLVTPDGQPYLIDFGTAVVCKSGGGFLNRRIFATACQLDMNAWIKHKYHGRFADIVANDRPYYRPTVVERLIRPTQKIWRRLTGRQWRKARRRRKDR